MKKTPIINQFDPVIYPVKLWVIKNPTPEFINEHFEEQDGKKLNFNISDAAAMSCYSEIVVSKYDLSYGLIISIWSKIEVGYIAHEATHAARFIWEHLCEDHTGIEADAYLVQWIAECIWKVKTKKENKDDTEKRK